MPKETSDPDEARGTPANRRNGELGGARLAPTNGGRRGAVGKTVGRRVTYTQISDSAYNCGIGRPDHPAWPPLIAIEPHTHCQAPPRPVK